MPLNDTPDSFALLRSSTESISALQSCRANVPDLGLELSFVGLRMVSTYYRGGPLRR